MCGSVLRLDRDDFLFVVAEVLQVTVDAGAGEGDGSTEKAEAQLAAIWKQRDELHVMSDLSPAGPEALQKAEARLDEAEHLLKAQIGRSRSHVPREIEAFNARQFAHNHSIGVPAPAGRLPG